MLAFIIFVCAAFFIFYRSGIKKRRAEIIEHFNDMYSIPNNPKYGITALKWFFLMCITTLIGASISSAETLSLVFLLVCVVSAIFSFCYTLCMVIWYIMHGNKKLPIEVQFELNDKLSKVN